MISEIWTAVKSAVMVPVAHAYTSNVDTFGGLAEDSLMEVRPQNVPTTDNFFVLLAKILNFFLQTVGVLLLLAIIYAGFLLLTAGGDEEKIALARRIIIYAIAGVVILALSFALVNWLLTGDSPFA